DLANAIAQARGFWLGDAFASGGSHGYDHKALGVTARGAWECVRAHFRELGVDADTAPLSVAGIGDMGGDVFGNGLLRSSHLRLQAAFNHRHVFLDPDPDPTRSFAERERLYRAGLGWDAYAPAALSPGGAVVARTAKRVVLSPEAQRLLGLASPEASGERLVQAVLTLDVDQLRSQSRLADFRDLIAELERTAGLDRALEALPDREALRARRGTFLGLTRPELAVLTAHTKIHLQREMLASPLPDDPLVESYLLAYFPAEVVARYPAAVRGHRLRREIIAAEVANAPVDHLGGTFVSRIVHDTGAAVVDVLRAWAVGWRLGGGDALAAAIAASAAAVDVESACRLALEASAERVTKWVLANTDAERPAAGMVADLG